MLVYEMKPICYNMYKWGGGCKRTWGGNNRKEHYIAFADEPTAFGLMVLSYLSSFAPFQLQMRWRLFNQLQYNSIADTKWDLKCASQLL